MQKEQLMGLINALLNDEPRFRYKYLTEILTIANLIQNATAEQIQNARERSR